MTDKKLFGHFDAVCFFVFGTFCKSLHLRINTLFLSHHLDILKKEKEKSSHGTNEKHYVDKDHLFIHFYPTIG